MKLNNKRTIYVGLAFMSIITFWQVYDNLVPFILKDTFGMNDGPIGIVMALDNVLALFMLPLFGRLSDRTKTRIGRRMPYIIVGTVVSLLCVLIMPYAERIESLPLFIFGLGLVLVAMATYRSPAVALMPDVTIRPLRSKGNAIINLMGAVGGALMLVVMMIFPVTSGGVTRGENYLIIFTIVAVFMGLCVAILVWKINEPQCVEEMQAEERKHKISDNVSEGDVLRENGRMTPPVFRSFVFILSSVFFWFFGYNAVTSAFSRYAAQELNGNFANVLLVCTIAAIFAYIPVGVIAARIGRKKTILIGICMLTVAFFSGAFFYSVTPLLFMFFIFAGFGWAFINVNSYPMVVELAGDGNVGKYTGYYYTVSMASQIMTPIFSGYLMQISYRILFPYATIAVAISFVTMLFVRHGDSKPVARKNIEVFEEVG